MGANGTSNKWVEITRWVFLLNGVSRHQQICNLLSFPCINSEFQKSVSVCLYSALMKFLMFSHLFLLVQEGAEALVPCPQR